MFRLYNKEEYKRLEESVRGFAKGEGIKEHVRVDVTGIYEKDFKPMWDVYSVYFPFDLRPKIDYLSTLDVPKEVLYGDMYGGDKIKITYQNIFMVTLGYYLDSKFKLNSKGVEKLGDIEDFKGFKGNLDYVIESQGIKVRINKEIDKEIQVYDIIYLVTEVVNKLAGMVEVYDKASRYIKEGEKR